MCTTKLSSSLIVLALGVALGCIFLPEPSMFELYPLTIETKLSSGTSVTIPYHNYGAEAILFLGSFDAKAVQAEVPPGFQPVLGDQGRALGMLMLVAYKNTSVDPYNEVIISYSISSASQPQLKGQHVLRGLTGLYDGQTLAMTPKLWLDKMKPISYGIELNGFPKHEASISMAHSNGKIHFKVDDKTGLVLESLSTLPHGLGLLKQMVSMVPALIPAFTWTSLVKLLTRKFTAWRVLTKPNLIPNGIPDAFPLTEFMVDVNPFDLVIGYTKEDEFKMGSELKGLGFAPELTAYTSNLKAVMPLPYAYVTR